MSEIPFHATVMGRRFYEHTMPELVRQVAQLNEHLERLVNAAEASPNPKSQEDKTDGREEEAEEADA